MPKAWLSELGARLPQIALAMLAAKRGGPEASAAFMGGLQESAQRREALTRQAQIDEERRGLQAQQDTRQERQMALQEQTLASQEARASVDDTRMAAADKQRRLSEALTYLDQYSQQMGATANDPVAAENAMLSRASMLEGPMGLPQGQLSPFLQPMAPVISARKQKQAEVVYARAEKMYGSEALANDSITLQTGELFGDVKPSQLRALFAPAAMNAQGQAIAPVVPAIADKHGLQPKDVTVGGKRRLVNYDPDTGEYYMPGSKVALTGDIQEYERPTQGPAADSARSWVLRNGQAVRVREHEIQPGDTPYVAPRSTSETAQDRQRKGRLDAARGFLVRLNELRETINTKMGPEAGLTGFARQGMAGIGMDPDVAEYERVRAAGGRSLAVAIMGAQNLSDADANAWANMLPGARVDAVTAKRLTDQIGRMLEETDTATESLATVPRGTPATAGIPNPFRH